MLIGIVKKNAIMMIDFALEAQRNGNMDASEAIYQGCLVRFRPIMMTTVAAMMGTLSIALGFGAGAESRRSLGISVVGGLMFSQIVTLFLTPVVYSLDLVPPKLRLVLAINPMAWDISSFQDIWFYGRLPRWPYLLGFTAVSLLTLVVGIVAYGRLSQRFAEEV